MGSFYDIFRFGDPKNHDLDPFFGVTANLGCENDAWRRLHKGPTIGGPHGPRLAEIGGVTTPGHDILKN